MKKLKLPKLKIKLSQVLAILLILAVVGELWIVYQYLYLNLVKKGEVVLPPQQSQAVRIDLKTYQEAKNWLQEKAVYEISSYSLDEGELGRENPFADY